MSAAQSDYKVVVATEASTSELERYQAALAKTQETARPADPRAGMGGDQAAWESKRNALKSRAESIPEAIAETERLGESTKRAAEAGQKHGDALFHETSHARQLRMAVHELSSALGVNLSPVTHGMHGSILALAGAFVLFYEALKKGKEEAEANEAFHEVLNRIVEMNTSLEAFAVKSREGATAFAEAQASIIKNAEDETKALDERLKKLDATFEALKRIKKAEEETALAKLDIRKATDPSLTDEDYARQKAGIEATNFAGVTGLDREHRAQRIDTTAQALREMETSQGWLKRMIPRQREEKDQAEARARELEARRKANQEAIPEVIKKLEEEFGLKLANKDGKLREDAFKQLDSATGKGFDKSLRFGDFWSEDPKDVVKGRKLRIQNTRDLAQLLKDMVGLESQYEAKAAEDAPAKADKALKQTEELSNKLAARLVSLKAQLDELKRLNDLAEKVISAEGTAKAAKRDADVEKGKEKQETLADRVEKLQLQLDKAIEKAEKTGNQKPVELLRQQLKKAEDRLFGKEPEPAADQPQSPAPSAPPKPLAQANSDLRRYQNNRVSAEMGGDTHGAEAWSELERKKEQEIKALRSSLMRGNEQYHAAVVAVFYDLAALAESQTSEINELRSNLTART